MTPRVALAGTVDDRIACFRPDLQPLLWILHALVKEGAFTAEAIVEGGFFADSALDKQGSRRVKIRAMQAFIDIVTLPEVQP